MAERDREAVRDEKQGMGRLIHGSKPPIAMASHDLVRRSGKFVQRGEAEQRNHHPTAGQSGQKSEKGLHPLYRIASRFNQVRHCRSPRHIPISKQFKRLLALIGHELHRGRP